MALKFPVKINQVADLSNARYVAGMGVDVIGLKISSSQLELNINQLKAIKSWLTGVDFVLEFEKGATNAIIETATKELACDTVELFFEDYENLKNEISKDLRVVLVTGEKKLVNESIPDECFLHFKNTSVDFFLENANPKAMFTFKKDINLNEILPFLEKNSFKNLCFDSGVESAPGFSDFGNLAEALEALELEE